MTLQKIAVVTEKATGHRYDCYSVPSDSDPAKSYTVAVRNGYAARCNCAWKQHHMSRTCKHQRKLQQWLDERRATAPLYRQPFSLLKGRF